MRANGDWSFEPKHQSYPFTCEVAAPFGSRNVLVWCGADGGTHRWVHGPWCCRSQLPRLHVHALRTDFASTACASDICICKDGNPPDTTTVVPILGHRQTVGGWTCGTPLPAARSFTCSGNPGLMAIPPGLLDESTALTELYGRPRPP